MNKQELINVPRILFPIGTEILIKGKIVGLKVLDDRFVENVVKLDYGEQIIAPNDAIYVKDEPQPVKVKQFVADWYEEHKDEFEYNVWDWLSSKSELRKIDSKFAFWLNDVDNTPIQTLVNMHQFGYEVEEEKRYLVKVKGIVNALSFLSYHKNADIWTVTDKNNSDGHRAHHTRKELEEANFGWVFDCPGIEIEEVE